MVNLSLFKSLYSNATVKSSLWLLFEKFILMAITFVVGIFVIRYLNAEEFGYYSYILSIYIVLEIFCTYGLNNEVVRQIVSSSKLETSQILGTAYLLQLIIGFICFIICFLYFYSINNQIFNVELIVFLALPIKSFRVISYYFDANVLGKYNAIIRTVVLICVNVLKIAIVVFELPIIYLYSTILLDACLFSVLYSIFYFIKRSKISVWKINLNLLKQYINVGWILMLSSFIITIYMRIDQVMITSILGNFQNGIYSAAIRISTVWYNIGWVIVLSVFPLLIRLYENDIKQFNTKLVWLIQLMILIGLTIGILILVFGDFLVGILFTTEYHASSTPLKIHIWSSVLVFILFIQEKWYIIYKKEKLFFLSCLTGLCINCLLNILTLEEFGIQSAAYNTIFGLLFSLFVFPCIFKGTRDLFYIQLKAIFSFYKLSFIKGLIKSDGGKLFN